MKMRQTDRQTGRHRDRETQRETDRDRDRQTETERDPEREIQRERESINNNLHGDLVRPLGLQFHTWWYVSNCLLLWLDRKLSKYVYKINTKEAGLHSRLLLYCDTTFSHFNRC